MAPSSLHLSCFRFLCALGFAIFRAAGDRSFHGGTLLAMAGRDCVVIASDSRFSSSQTGSFMLGQFPRSIYRIGSKTMIGFYGLDSDARTVVERLRERLLDHEDAHVQPSHLARVLSDTLYASGLLTSPILVGMEDDGRPFICSMDGLGAQTVTDSFAVAGTANTGLYAQCESAYRPGLTADELVDVVERCMRMALQVPPLPPLDAEQASHFSSHTPPPPPHPTTYGCHGSATP